MFKLFNESSSSSSAAKPSEVLKPTLIMGDLDSLSPSVRKHYAEQGIPCMDLSADQDSTDLDKCLAHVKQRQSEERQRGGCTQDQEDLVVVVGALRVLKSVNLQVSWRFSHPGSHRTHNRTFIQPLLIRHCRNSSSRGGCASCAFLALRVNEGHALDCS